VPQIAQMTDSDPIQAEAKYGVLPSEPSLLMVMIGPDPPDLQAQAAVLTFSLDHLGAASPGMGIAMIGVGMADQYYIRLQSGQRVAHGILKEGIEKDADALLTLQQKTGVSEPGYYHGIFISASG